MRVGIFHTAFIGDVALLGLLIDALAQNDLKPVLFTRKSAAQLFAGDVRLDKIVVVDKGKSIAEKVRRAGQNARLVSHEHLDIILVPHLSFYSAFLCRMAGVRRRVGFDRSQGNLLFTHHVPWKAEDHESVRYLSLFPAELDRVAACEKLRRAPWGFLKNDGELKKFSEIYTKFFDDGAPFFVVSPGSVWPTKCYPIESYASVVVSLLRKNAALRCVVSGSLDEAAQNARLVHLVGKMDGALKDRVFDASSVLPLVDLVSLMRKANFVLCNDSAPVHIASGVNVPTIAIYGPTPIDTGMTPLAQKHKIVYYSRDSNDTLECQPCSAHGAKTCPLGHHMCMKDLSPDVVVREVCRLLPEMFERSE